VRRSVGSYLSKFSVNFLSRGAEFFDRAAHASGKFGQLLRAKQQQDNKENDQHVWSHEVEDTSDRNRHKKISDMFVS
jgi:hypothetical protein